MSDITLIDEAFTEQERIYKEEWEESEQLFENKHARDLKKRAKKRNRSALFVPVTQNTILIAYSVFTSSFLNNKKCPIKAINDSADGEIADDLRALNMAISHYWERSKPRLAISQAFMSALLYRLGAMAVYWDKSRGAPKAIHIPTTDIAFDPQASSPDDVEYVCYRYKLSGRDIKNKLKSGYFTPKKRDKENIESLIERETERQKIKEIYKRDGSGWNCKTFINDLCLRDESFNDIPFKWGIVLPQLPKINKTSRQDQIMAYGGSFVGLFKEIQREINQKRNQKNDLQEERITPTAIINTDQIAIDPNEMQSGPGKIIEAKGANNALAGNIIWRQPAGEYELNNDLGIVNQDLENATGINNILRGNTNPSDRRSQAALTLVNSNSSSRLEDMIALINETLFSHFAKTFARLVYKNAPDELIMKLTGGKNPIGVYGARRNFDYQIGVEFGNSLNQQTLINNIITALQMVQQNPAVNPNAINRLVEEILTLLLGDNARIEEIFAPPPPDPQALEEQAAAQMEQERAAAEQANIQAAIAAQEEQKRINKFVEGTL
ncbi:MAG: hypothetical protein LBU73_05075 [Helicobacteraceae bacterium]|jgi:hypothetical protein|nr:hypothetical protein [Helicobacteraceae bacterium]